MEVRAPSEISRAHSLAGVSKVGSLTEVKAIGAPAARWIAAARKARKVEMVAFMVYGVKNVSRGSAVNTQWQSTIQLSRKLRHTTGADIELCAG